MNTDAASLDGDLPLPDSSLTLLMDVTEQALIERPEAVLRSLTELRTRGWGVALDDVGADSRSLALTSVLYPDVIKLDLRLLDERSAEDAARIVMAVGAEAERRHAVILAEGIDSAGAARRRPRVRRDAGRGLPPRRRPGRSRTRCPSPAGRCGSRAAAATRSARRPGSGSPTGAGLSAATARWPRRRSSRCSSTPPSSARRRWCSAAWPIRGTPRRRSRRFGWLTERVALVGVLNAGDAFDGTGVRGGALADGDPLCGAGHRGRARPGLRRLLRRPGRTGTLWEWAISYDRETVVECALQLIARMEPLR